MILYYPIASLLPIQDLSENKDENAYCAVEHAGDKEDHKMTTLKHIGDLVIDSTGPLRKIRLPDGLYVVGQQMLIAVASDEEAEQVIEELKDYEQEV